jgi:uncharacterized protein (TIGR03437 family)
MNGYLRNALLACTILPAVAQTTTNFNATFVLIGEEIPTEGFVRSFVGTAPVGTLGNALVILGLTQTRLTEPNYDSGIGPFDVGLTLAFNRVDRLTLPFSAIQDPNFPTATVGGRVSGGTGAYAGASTTENSMRLTVTRMSTSPLRYNVSLNGSMTFGGQTLNLAVTNVPVVQTATVISLFDTDSGTCSIPPFGAGTFTARSTPNPRAWNDNLKFIELNLTCAFSESDSVQAFLILTPVNAEEFTPGPITFTGGTGRFAGASGSARVTGLTEGPGDRVTVTTTGSITEAGPTTPIITSVNTAYWPPAGGISQNTWIEIKGTNLAPASTPAGGTFWSNASEFAQGRMPTEVGGVSVTVNGKAAYVWWFCSKATTPACATDQINVLTPLDDYEGQVMVVVKNGAASSGAFLTNKGPVNPSVLLFSARGDAVATHGNASLVGPASLFPGASTPARRGETISLWATGFGLPATPLVAGSSTQSGPLPSTPACYLGGATAQVAAALVSPGLYQLNVTVGDNAAAGDNHFFCTFGSTSTLGALIAVQ